MKGVDRFGHNVGVNYRGSGHFKTFAGAIATVLNLIVIVDFSVKKIVSMYTRQSQSTFSQKTYIDMFESPSLNLLEERFQIGYSTKHRDEND